MKGKIKKILNLDSENDIFHVIFSIMGCILIFIYIILFILIGGIFIFLAFYIDKEIMFYSNIPQMPILLFKILLFMLGLLVFITVFIYIKMEIED